MEADISIWQKPGHFYFALTRRDTKRQRETAWGSRCLTDSRAVPASAKYPAQQTDGFLEKFAGLFRGRVR
jgi:hypothetical protein